MTKINETAYLTPEDYALLFYVWQNRLMTTRHFIAKFWPGLSKRTADRRLNKKIEAGLMNRVEIPWLKEKVLYTATKAGNKALISIGLLDLKFCNDYPKRSVDFTESMKHDLQVVDIRIAFENSGAVAEWISDHEMRLARRSLGLYSRTPDGVFKLETDEGQIEAVLELERATYRQHKFRTILTRLKTYYPNASVVFVVKGESRLTTMTAWTKAAGSRNENSSHIYFATYEVAMALGIPDSLSDLNGMRPKWKLQTNGICD